jgi:hypothetical protein
VILEGDVEKQMLFESVDYSVEGRIGDGLLEQGYMTITGRKQRYMASEI